LVYAPTSIGARREWYARLDLEVTAETDEYLETADRFRSEHFTLNHLETADGFRSEHFTLNRIRSLMGRCEVEPIGDIGYLVFA
jgi:hypothetical protein